MFLLGLNNVSFYANRKNTINILYSFNAICTIYIIDSVKKGGMKVPEKRPPGGISNGKTHLSARFGNTQLFCPNS